MTYESARTKAEAVARMYFLGNRVVEPLGPGSKEKKSALVALGRFVHLDLEDVPGKHECARAIAEAVGVRWDESCVSGGDTVTLEGLNRLVDGAVEAHIRSGALPVRSLVRDLVGLNPAPRWDEVEDDDVPEDFSEIEQNIADAVAELASGGPAPLKVDAARAPFASGAAIKLEDGSWRTALAEVQGWLHLPATIDQSDADRFDRSLASLLSMDTSASIAPADLFERLQERLDRAVDNRRAFQEALDSEMDGSTTLEAASSAWEAAWDEVEETEEAESSGPIRAEAATWPIAQFRQYAMDGEMDLNPSYQRADVWPTGDAQLLIESVLRGIPLPSVILLQRNTDEGDRYEIVDGKQRLTSLLRFTAAHPKALATVRTKAQEWGESPEDMLEQFTGDYPKFRKTWRRHEATNLSAKQEKELYFPFHLRKTDAPTLSGDLEQLRGRYYSEIKPLAIQVGNAKKKIRALFEEVSDYRIPVIVYYEASSRQIHEVFSLYNKQGKHLNAEEIRNAAFHELDFMRALLATGGDTDGIDRVAPFLAPVWDDVQSTGRALANPNGPYAMPDAGYKRTKALSWVAAALLMEDENASTRSTTAHVNNLLKRIERDATDPLRDPARVARAMVLLDAAMDAHQAAPPEIWSKKFRGSQARWQELQLVASLLALAAASVVLDRELSDRVDERAEELRAVSERWARPTKSQSREQWQFIGGVVREFLEVLDVDAAETDRAVRSAFGSSGLAALVTLPQLPEWPSR
ncbi:DUF262 domain-containing protein [Cellulomonas gelida]|uniref:GmrSD restriction endonucleases N-terminal domain-containing protein n=1 Tax=Cellulomonas gelida TaxID=1712 RepID=A0A4Y3KMM4_9CELL|nr:DUF262 domain-containing protein [Cellulomonas gelida]GEA84168.1 hypothetical protein CGE01nite_14190 [Cellulomonas gelida]GGL19559.1 hypothetical protein GCM10009774_07280 [Cellulomonas gelida]